MKLLKLAGLVNEEKNTAEPSRLLVGKADYATILRGVTLQFKKEYPYLRGKYLQTAVGMHMLNLAPNESLAVREGYAIVLGEDKS